MPYRAFVSSTFTDLEQHRAQVIRQLESAGLDVDPMENWTADNDEPKTFSQKRLNGCNLCVLLVAFRRGHIPAGETLSITQLEYEAARQAGIDVLVFMLDPEDVPWRRSFDELDKDPEIRKWRALLRERHGCGVFGHEPTSLDVSGAVSRWIQSQPGNENTPPPTWLRRHLELLLRKLDALSVPVAHEDRFRVVPLNEIYVPLTLRFSKPLVDDNAPALVRVLRRALDSKLVALTGDAGSGKSTFLRYFAVKMAKQLLNRAPNEGGEAARIPIHLDLAASASELLKPEAGQRLTGISPSRWLALLASELELTEKQVKGLLDEGKVVFLFDGLDEVPQARDRELILDGIIKMQRKYGPLDQPNPVVIACRDTAWAGSDVYAWFERVAIEPMDPAKMREYLTSWCRAIWGDEASAIISTLERSAIASPAIAANPQMATLLALVEHDGTMPKQQAVLIDRFVQKLVRSDRRGTEDSQAAHRRYLTALAVAMQDCARVDGDAFNSLRVEEAEGILGACVERETGRPLTLLKRQQEGRTLLDALQVQTGLIELQRSSEGGQQRAFVRFRHRIFQEYLAAEHYADGRLDDLLKHVTDPAWSTILALTSGVLARVGSGTVKHFLEDVLQTPAVPERGASAELLVEWAPRVAAASVCLTELASYDLDAEALEPARRANNLVVPLLEDPATTVDIRTRTRIAEGLGTIHDPRLRSRSRWVTIGAGPFIRGSVADEAWIQERPRIEATLSEFRIQRWPITVAEYRRFIEEGDGYRAGTWWTDEHGRRWKERTGVMQPRGWEKNRSKGNRPVTGVSWWEACAFCRWLETIDPGVPEGWVVQLPSESQWEKAARGETQPNERESTDIAEKSFPWGNSWGDGPANCLVTGIADVVPVGLFPAGHSRPYGLWDVAGNISEHCLDGFAPYGANVREDPVCSDFTHGHVLRGGSYLSPPLDLRITNRWGHSRDEQDEHVGFRCVAVPRATGGVKDE